MGYLSLGVVGLLSLNLLSGGLVLGMAVDQLDADLLGEGQLDGLAGGSGQTGHTFVNRLGHGLDLGDGDALLLGEVLAGDSGELDGLVHTGLDGLGVHNLYR